MQQLKVMTIVGTRPEVIKLSRVIAELEKYTHHILVHSGQNYDYELNEVFFKDLEIKKPDYFLEAATGESVAQDIANVISRIDPILEKERPDAVLFYGDTNTTLAVIAAKRRQIPVFHMEAGNRCFDQRVPEEINRKVLDHLSDINMTISEHARRYLLNEGLKPETVIKVGSSMKEVFDYYMPKVEASDVLKRLNVKPQNYFIVSAHREDNVDSEQQLQNFLEVLNNVAHQYNKKVIVSTHPRTRKRLDALAGKKKVGSLHPEVEFMKPFGFLDYIHLMRNAHCVLSDSGSITEDASILDFPAITIRRMHERPEGMDVGTLVMSELRSDRILSAIHLLTNGRQTEQKRSMAIASDYDVENVSKKVVRIITSYVDYINRTVWHKHL